MTTTPMNDADRLAFEKWHLDYYKQEGFLGRDADGHYEYGDTNDEWNAFQAGLAHARAWRLIDDTAKSGKPILGFCLIESSPFPGFHTPNKQPYVCRYVPEDDEYPAVWETLDAYGDVENNDCQEPTHYQPITPPQAQEGGE